MNNLKIQKYNTEFGTKSKPNIVLSNLLDKKNHRNKELWKQTGYDIQLNQNDVEVLVKTASDYETKVYKAKIHGYPNMKKESRNIQFSGKMTSTELLKYLGDRENIVEKVNKIQSFAYGMLFKTKEYDIFVNNPYLEEKIKEYKVVEVVNSKLYQNDNSFITDFKEENPTIKHINEELFNKIDEDKLYYYTGEFWLGMKSQVIIGDYIYKVHQDHDNKEFIVDNAYSQKYDKFKNVIDFSAEEEYKIKRQLLFKDFRLGNISQ